MIVINLNANSADILNNQTKERLSDGCTEKNLVNIALPSRRRALGISPRIRPLISYTTPALFYFVSYRSVFSEWLRWIHAVIRWYGRYY